jgi:ketosteroid isomerase-like protein
MSRENLDVVRSSYEREDLRFGPTWATIDPDFEYHTLSTEPDAGIYRGHEGFRELLALWTDMFDDLRIEPEEFIDAGDYVIVPSRIRGKGRSSGVDIDASYVLVWKVRNGLRTECREYATTDAALEAVRLAGAGESN